MALDSLVAISEPKKRIDFLSMPLLLDLVHLNTITYRAI